MAKLPEFMLRAFYVKGSLQNEGSGFRFEMKNELGPARIISARPLLLDRKPIPVEMCRFIHGDQEAMFTDVSPENSVLMRKGEAVIVRVEGTTLHRGRRTLGINVVVKDLGPISFTVTDQVA